MSKLGKALAVTQVDRNSNKASENETLGATVRLLVYLLNPPHAEFSDGQSLAWPELNVHPLLLLGSQLCTTFSKYSHF